MDTTQFILALLGTAGGSAFLATMGKGITSWLSGKAGRERIRNSSALAQSIKEIERRETAEQETEDEIRLRRRAEHHVSLLQRQLILLGVTPVENDQDQKEGVKRNG